MTCLYVLYGLNMIGVDVGNGVMLDCLSIKPVVEDCYACKLIGRYKRLMEIASEIRTSPSDSRHMHG